MDSNFGWFLLGELPWQVHNFGTKMSQNSLNIFVGRNARKKNEPSVKGPKSSQKNPPVSCNHYLGLGSVCVACLCCLGFLLGSCAKLALEQLAKEEKSWSWSNQKWHVRNVMIYVRVLLGQRHKSYLQGSFRFLSSHLCPLMKWFGRDLISGRSKRHQSFWGEKFCLKTDNSPRRKLANFKWGQWNRDQNDKRCIHHMYPKTPGTSVTKAYNTKTCSSMFWGSSLSEKKRFTLNQLPLFYI